MHAERYGGNNVKFLKSFYSSHKSAQFMRNADILKEVVQRALAGTLNAQAYYSMFRAQRDLVLYGIGRTSDRGGARQTGSTFV
jgi:hypothetical protein